MVVVMKITTTKGKSVTVKDSIIQKYMKDFSLTKEDAIQMYLEDEGFEDNEDVEEMTAKAKENKAVMHGESVEKDERKVANKKQSKPKTVKVSDTKKELFSEISQFLSETFGENAEVLKENKLIQVKIGEDIFKIDIIQQRKPK